MPQIETQLDLALHKNLSYELSIIVEDNPLNLNTKVNIHQEIDQNNSICNVTLELGHTNEGSSRFMHDLGKLTFNENDGEILVFLKYGGETIGENRIRIEEAQSESKD